MQLVITDGTNTYIEQLVVATGGGFAPVALPNTDIVFFPPATLDVDDAWTIAATRDLLDLGVVLRELDASGAVESPLGDDAAEPWTSWRNIWRSSLPAADRLAVAALALAARTAATPKPQRLAVAFNTLSSRAAFVGRVTSPTSRVAVTIGNAAWPWTAKVWPYPTMYQPPTGGIRLPVGPPPPLSLPDPYLIVPPPLFTG